MGLFETFTTDRSSIFYMHQRLNKFVPYQLNKSWLWSLILKKGKGLTMKGRALEIPIDFGPSVNTAWINFGDRLPTGYSESYGMGYVTPRFFAVPIQKDLLTERMDANDPGRHFDAIRMRQVHTEWAMARGLASSIWTGDGGVEPDGILRQIEKAAPASQTFSPYGVPKSTYAFMRNGYVQLPTNVGVVASNSTIPNGLLYLMTIIDRATMIGYRPDVVVTTRKVWQVLYRAFHEVTSYHHAITDAGTAQFGFQTFSFMGVDIGWDDNCPADTVVALHVADRASRNYNVGLLPGENPNNLDSSLDEVAGASSLYELDTNIVPVFHSQFNKWLTSETMPAQNMTSSQWLFHSFNLLIKQPRGCVISGSVSGTGWETW